MKVGRVASYPQNLGHGIPRNKLATQPTPDHARHLYLLTDLTNRREPIPRKENAVLSERETQRITRPGPGTSVIIVMITVILQVVIIQLLECFISIRVEFLPCSSIIHEDREVIIRSGLFDYELAIALS